jgi:hypothetical protein
MELPARASKANVEDQKESVKPNSKDFKGHHHKQRHNPDPLFSSVPNQDGFWENRMV